MKKEFTNEERKVWIKKIIGERKDYEILNVWFLVQS